MTTLWHGDCLRCLQELEDSSLDSLVTDPPAGIAFMGKDWDKDKGGRDNWIAWMREVMEECLRVLKPGAHGFVWALPRNSHWTATALEDAGFEVRDVVTHIFGSGFPKNHDVSKAIDKMHGAEREVVGSKLGQPGYSLKENDTKNHGRKAYGKYTNSKIECEITSPSTQDAKKWEGWGTSLKPSNEHWILVRKPLEKKLTVAKNVLKHGTGAINIDASRIGTDKLINRGMSSLGSMHDDNWVSDKSIASEVKGRFPANTIVDESAVDELGEASRFFYCPKASKKDKGSTNNHPTVKNTKLMSYLIKMITPPNGTVLDPFMGSGSTGVAAKRDGFSFVGIEKEQEYYDIACARIGEI